MIIKLSTSLILMSLIISGCTAPKLLTKPETNEKGSGVLFYKQADTAEPFLDSLLTNPADSAVIKAVLVPPPPPPPPAFREMEGYRVQVFAGVDSLKAVQTRKDLRRIIQDSTYIIKEAGLFKVKAGDFLYYPPADSLKKLLKQNNFERAWAARGKILVPNTIGRDSVITERAASSQSQQQAKFRIQVFVTSDEAKALAMIQKLQQSFSWPAAYLNIDDLYKIFIGRFPSRAEAETALEKIRNQGYPKAFLSPID